MAFLDGKKKPARMSGGNVQRESFNSGVDTGKTMRPVKAMPEGARGKPDHQGEEGESTTTITHHADGSHTAVHHDGEEVHHPHVGHLAMTLHAKHSDGEAMHVHNHHGSPMHEMEGHEPHHTVTTHHVGMDGGVEGPHHHESMEAAAEHMKSMIGEDGGNGATMAMHENPEDQEYLG